MFFSWFDQNKSFRKGGNLAGQVTPFLIIILVILLVAAVVTINIGRVSLDKTCSANAADAGSLAAASAWAGALNSLTKTNEEVLQTSYDYNYYAYGQLYNQAEGYIDEAIILCVVAAPLSLGALYAMNPPCTEDTIWVGGIIGAVLDAAASYMLFEAAMGVAAFNVTVSYMQSITDSFHEQQWRNYCDARDFMDESWTNANEIGLIVVFTMFSISSM